MVNSYLLWAAQGSAAAAEFQKILEEFAGFKCILYIPFGETVPQFLLGTSTPPSPASLNAPDPQAVFEAQRAFELWNCGNNVPQIQGNAFAIVAQQFDMRPNLTTGVAGVTVQAKLTDGQGIVISGSIYGQDQILCGNVNTTEWVVTEYKASNQPGDASVALPSRPATVRLRSRTESSRAVAGRMPFAGSGRCTEFARDASVGRGFRSSYRPADRFGCLWSSHASHVLLKGSMTHLLRL